jgi:TRAP-type mannitol/chloroaromatic compound transport system substrate-binding protein
MQRRQFVKYVGLGLTAAGAATLPSLGWASRASSREMPSIEWHLASSVPQSLDIIYKTACGLAKRVADLTDGKFIIHLSAAGEKIPAYGVLDAVRQNTVECGHTCGYYYHDENKAFSLDTAIPFGLSARQMNAWCYDGDGLTLLREFFAKFNIVNFPGGNSGTQMGGWFRKEIKSPADLRNLRIRIPGFGAEVLRSMKAVPQMLPGGDIYPALKSGKLDAAEWVGPYDDEKLGFDKVAKYYYYPAWWEPGPMFSFYVNKTQWERLPGPYQAAFDVAAVEANMSMIASYDARNPQAIRRLIQKGVELRRYPDAILKAAYRAAQKIYAAESAVNEDFKKIYASMRAFQKDSNFWMGLAESSMSNFMQTGADA